MVKDLKPEFNERELLSARPNQNALEKSMVTKTVRSEGFFF